jgi:hypothetical protein
MVTKSWLLTLSLCLARREHARRLEIDQETAAAPEDAEPDEARPASVLPVVELEER